MGRSQIKNNSAARTSSLNKPWKEARIHVAQSEGFQGCNSKKIPGLKLVLMTSVCQLHSLALFITE